jgi:putative nucleotidyltransferase with HDIG domain
LRAAARAAVRVQIAPAPFRERKGPRKALALKDTAPTVPALPKALQDLFEAKLATGELELPFLPETASQVMSACNDEVGEPRKVADLIQRDLALSAHVLHIANSAAYAPNEPIVSLPQAVSRLGLATVCDLAVAVAIQGRVFNVSGHQVKIRELWQHSAMAGCYAKEIARLRRFNVEGAFTCGLMHDIGRPMVMLAFIDLLSGLTDKRAPYTLLQAAMDQFHARVGGLLVDQWGLPPWVKTSILHHHGYAEAQDSHEDVMCTHLADELAKWAIQPELAEEDFDFDLPVLSDLNLYRDEVEVLLKRRSVVLDVAEAFL